MHDLRAVSDSNKAALVAIGTAVLGMLSALFRWVLRNEHRVTDLERAQRDAETQHALDVARLTADITSLRERCDTYFQGPRQ